MMALKAMSIIQVEEEEECINMDKWNDVDMMPMWMKISMMICKWLICVMPFVICSLLMFFKSEMSLWDNMLLTCVYLLSLSSVINMVD